MRQFKLSDLEDTEDNINKSIDNATWFRVEKWIRDNYQVTDLTYIYDNEKDIYKVSSKGNVRVKNLMISSLTNEDFKWDVIGGCFDCRFCNYLISLKGAPYEIGEDFNCSSCGSLETLEGAPQKVYKNFYCTRCVSLKSLRGSPYNVEGHFSCSFCDSLKSLEGAPPVIGKNFYCTHCTNLISLKGTPDRIGGSLNCSFCDSLVSFEEVSENIADKITLKQEISRKYLM